MTDYLKIKPLKTFDAGSGLKTAESEPFDIEAGHGRELIALKYAEEVGSGEAPAEPEPAKPITTDGVGKPKQKGKTDGHNEGS